jgi:MFS family permease
MIVPDVTRRSWHCRQNDPVLRKPGLPGSSTRTCSPTASCRGGRLGDFFGHRRLFLAGITLFTLASLVCGLSTTQGMLVGARAVQGLGGAVASAVSLSLMMTLFAEPGERAKAMGIFGFVASGGGSIGVLLGGVLTDVLNWHWIFLVNLPIGILVVFLTLRLLPADGVPSAPRTPRRRGAVTVTAALMLAVYGRQRNEAGHPRRRQGSGGVGIPPPRVPRDRGAVPSPLMPCACGGCARGLRTASASSGRVRCSPGSSLVASTEAVLHYSPLEVGLAFLPANLIMGALDRPLPKLVMRHGISCRSAAAAAGGDGLGRSCARLSGSCRRRAPEHDPARHRRGRRVQPQLLAAMVFIAPEEAGLTPARQHPF